MFSFRNISLIVRHISGLYRTNLIVMHYISYYNMCKLKRFFFQYVSFSNVYLFDIILENRWCNKKKWVKIINKKKTKKKHLSNIQCFNKIYLYWYWKWIRLNSFDITIWYYSRTCISIYRRLLYKRMLLNQEVKWWN